jgi:branched-chain amino acid transport system substrate-binding protein
LKKGTILVVVYILVIAAMVFGACSAPAAPSTPSTPSTPAAPAAPKTLKIGMNVTYNWPLGLDMNKMCEIDKENINKAGGLSIGGQKYLLDLLWDDNKMDIALAKTLAQKHIAQDGVSFICADTFTHTIIPVVNEAKIPTCMTVYESTVFDPKWDWVWNAGAGLTIYPALAMWCAEKYPNLKTYVIACPDRMDGRIAGATHAMYAKAGGLKVLQEIYYPPTSTDLSAIGTQIKQLNPDILDVHGGGPPMDATIMKAAFQSGWHGTVLASATAPGSVMMGIAGPDAAEGMIGIAWPFESFLDPPATDMAKKFKADFIAKYGKFEDTEPVIAYIYYNLIDAIKKADSIDKNKVKAAFDAGFSGECPLGNYQRVPRPLENNMRMVDMTGGNLVTKQIKNGKVVSTGFLTLEDSVRYYNAVYGKK